VCNSEWIDEKWIDEERIDGERIDGERIDQRWTRGRLDASPRVGLVEE
jgi:hypothetical protein